MSDLSVGIFRLQLFKISEGFIARQAGAFRCYQPVYLGRKMFGPAPDGAPVIVPRPGHALSQAAIIGFRAAWPFIDALNAQRRSLRLIHAHFAVDGIYALPLARALNLPLVTTLHGFDVSSRDSALLRSGRPAKILSVLHRRSLASQGRLFVCVSEFIRRAALAKGFPKEKLLVHHMGIDTSSLSPDRNGRAPATITHVARLVEKKGTVYLLRAVARLRDAFPELRLNIIGDGPLRPQLEEEARGLGDTVRFLGALPNTEVLGLMRQSTLIALPSVTAASGDAEGLPTVALETAALGVPIVATDSGGIAEAVIDGVTGYVVPERDVDALSDRLSRLLTDPALAARMGAGARHIAEQNFDIARQSAKLEQLYDRVLAGETAWG